MNQFTLLPVEIRPFPHVIADDYLDSDLYRALADSFPACPASSGPTGFSYFWGDREYEALLARSEAWRTLFERFHSQDFVDHALAQFASLFQEGARVDLSEARYVPYLESRRDKERPSLARAEHAPDELWVRLDILQGRLGYHRGPHLDHRRRAATILLYFCDADDIGMVGGELQLHSPAGEGGEPVSIAPRHNRMVMFPCHNASLHSVSPILEQAGPRNFVQITLSSSVDLWEPVAADPPLGLPARVAARSRGLVGSLVRRFG